MRILAIVLLSCNLCSAAPPRSHTLTISLDDGFESRMLKSEIERDWTKPTAVLNQSQSADLKAKGAQLNAIRHHLLGLTIRYTDVSPPGIRQPAVKFGSGHFEPMDRRCFRYSSLPLRSLAWMRDAAYDGDAEARQLAEWEVARKVRFKQESEATARVERAVLAKYPQYKRIQIFRRWIGTGDEPPEFCECDFPFSRLGDVKGATADGPDDSYVELDLTGIDCRVPPTIEPFRFALPKPPWLGAEDVWMPVVREGN